MNRHTAATTADVAADRHIRVGGNGDSPTGVYLRHVDQSEAGKIGTGRETVSRSRVGNGRR